MSYIGIDTKIWGRKQIHEQLKKRVLGLKEGYRQNVAILGDPCLGKSLTICNFLDNLDEEGVISIYLDVEKRDFHYFAYKFIGSLLFNYSKAANIPLHDDIHLLVESLRDALPQTTAVVDRILDDVQKNRITHAYLGLLALPEIFTNETGQFCVLVLDEFQDMENFDIPEVFQVLGKKIMTHKRCLYIVASSDESNANRILSEKLSLLFGNFEILHIHPFSLAESQQYIEGLLDDCKIGSQLCNFLTDFTGGHPLYLRLIAKELIHLSALHRQKEIYLPLLSQAIENSLFDKWGIISRHFELVVSDLTAKGQKNVTNVLVAIADGANKAEELVNMTKLKKSFVLSRVNKLIELGIIIKNGNVFYFKDKLLKFWLKHVYQRRLNFIELSPDKQRQAFKDDFKKLVESFMTSSRQTLSTRITELVHCFENESIDLNGRNYKLPRFDAIEPLQVKGEHGVHFDVLHAKTQKAAWFIVMKKDHVLESDVTTFINEAKKIEKKSVKYLLISMADLDENVKLRALQERFWVWSESEINTLLTYFDKPFIVK